MADHSTSEGGGSPSGPTHSFRHTHLDPSLTSILQTLFGGESGRVEQRAPSLTQSDDSLLTLEGSI